MDRPIIGFDGEILACVVPSPNHPSPQASTAPASDKSPSYQASSTRFFDKMMAFGEEANFTPAELTHKRGIGFAAINAGLSYGMGHKKPSWLKHGTREAMVSNLLDDEDLRRLAAYQDG